MFLQLCLTHDDDGIPVLIKWYRNFWQAFEPCLDLHHNSGCILQQIADIFFSRTRVHIEFLKMTHRLNNKILLLSLWNDPTLFLQQMFWSEKNRRACCKLVNILVLSSQSQYDSGETFALKHYFLTTKNDVLTVTSTLMGIFSLPLF